MQLLVSGPGVEDPRSPRWAHLVRPLVDLGHDVFAFDLAEADRRRTKGSVDDQLHWVLREVQPELTLVSGVGPELEPLAQLCKSIAVPVCPADDIGPIVNVDMLARNIPSNRSVAPVDVVILGDATDSRIEKANRLLATFEGSLVCIGRSWSDLKGIRSHGRGPIHYPYLGGALRNATLAVVFDDDGQALEDGGPMVNALDAMAAGIPVVVEAGMQLGFSLEEARFSSIEDMPTTLQAMLADPTARRTQEKNANSAVRMRHNARTSLVPLLSKQAETPRIRVTKDGPRVSFITGSYNIREFIGHAIESILGQTHDDVEVIVMNDGSPDDSSEVVRRYTADPRVRLLEQSNIGQTGRFDFMWKRLLEHARGDFLCSFGGDDIAQPDRVRKQLEVLDAEPDVGVVHTAGIAIDENGTRSNNLFELDVSYDSSSQLRRLIRGNNVADPTALIRRSVLENLNSWTGGFACDYRFWLKASRVTTFRYLAEPLTHYRIHAKSASSAAGGGLSSAGQQQGLMTRLDERKLCGITDLFPVLRNVPEDDTSVWAAAYMDVGNGHVRYIPNAAAAIREYERAKEILPALGAVLDFNIACAYKIENVELQRSHALYESALQRQPDLARFASHFDQLHINAMVPAGLISTVPFTLPDELARATKCWDGTMASTKRVLIRPDWNNLDELQMIIGAFFEICGGRPDADLVVPLTEVDLSVALTELPLLLPPLAAEARCSLTLEEWHDLSFLPMERFAAVVDLTDSQPSAARRSFSRNVFQLLGI